jgi:hypothetical protein
LKLLGRLALLIRLLERFERGVAGQVEIAGRVFRPMRSAHVFVLGSNFAGWVSLS